MRKEQLKPSKLLGVKTISNPLSLTYIEININQKKRQNNK